MNDNLDVLLRDLALAGSGLHRIEHPVSGAVAIFPSVEVHAQGSKEARAAEDVWEAKSLAMHAAQESITLAPKPSENQFANKKVTRGD